MDFSHAQNLIDHSIKHTLRPRTRDRIVVLQAALQYIVDNFSYYSAGEVIINTKELEDVISELEEIQE